MHTFTVCMQAFTVYNKVCSGYCQASFYTYFMDWTMQALRVLNKAWDHERQEVPAMTILFNIKICQVEQMIGQGKRQLQGVEGVDHKGTRHQFLEGTRLYFSTKLFDVKCMPWSFIGVLQTPQTAVVYLQSIAEEEEVTSVQNLSIVTITEVTCVPHLVVRKMSDSGDQMGPTFTVPANADLEVVLNSIPCYYMFG